MVKDCLSQKSIGEIKRYNLQMQILGLLYHEQQTKASWLSKALNLSLPTIRNMLESLMESNLVIVKGNAKSKGGRIPLVYQLNPDAFGVVAIEIGHYFSKLVLMNCHNMEVSEVVQIEANIDDSALETILYEAYQGLQVFPGHEKIKIVGVGVSMPGLVDAEKGINYTVKEVLLQNMAQRFGKAFCQPVVVENDARMQALGELLFGKARNAQNALVVNWNWGLGLGIIHEGQIYSGAVGFAGEFSHIRIVGDGDLCECGKTGCLQTIASLRYLLRIAHRAIEDGVVSQLTARFKGNVEGLEPAHIVTCALKGDELSLMLLRKVSENLAWGLSILIQLYNPELILIKGPLTAAGQHITIPLSLALNQYCLNEIVGRVAIDVADSDDDMGLKGVAALVFKKQFNCL